MGDNSDAIDRKWNSTRASSSLPRGMGKLMECWDLVLGYRCLWLQQTSLAHLESILVERLFPEEGRCDGRTKLLLQDGGALSPPMSMSTPRNFSVRIFSHHELQQWSGKREHQSGQTKARRYILPFIPTFAVDISIEQFIT